MINTLYTCPRCKEELPQETVGEDGYVVCASCGALQRHLAFPALRNPIPTEEHPQRIQSEEEAHCAFHETNRAETPCDRCGRYLCSVCAMPLEGKTYCPACLEQLLSGGGNHKYERRYRAEELRYDLIVLYLAFLPIITFWLPIFTAPMALVLGFIWLPRVLKIPECSLTSHLIGMLAAGFQVVLILILVVMLFYEVFVEI